jgi:hypothetical protein
LRRSACEPVLSPRASADTFSRKRNPLVYTNVFF